MHNHFHQYLNIRQWILSEKPQHVLEVGAGTGECTQLLQALRAEHPFTFTVLTDRCMEGMTNVYQLRGISYQVLPTMTDASVDMALIDTDHNYWTLRCELDALDPKLREGGFILLHDVETFYHATGMAMTYGNGTDYPTQLIESTGLTRGGLMDAVIDFLAERRFSYRLAAFTTASQGACVLKKQQEMHHSFVLPGPDSSYAPGTQAAVAAWMQRHQVTQESAVC